VNPIDAGVRAGKVLPDEPDRFPMVLGWDGAGVVEAVGAGTTDLVVGQRVMAMSRQPATGVGLHAELAVLPVEQVVPLPASVTSEAAAATPLAGITALNAVESLGLAPGQSVYLNNPEGAVGGFAVQIARLLGLVVVEDPAPGSVDGAADLRGGTEAREAFEAVRSSGAYTTVVPEWWKPSGVHATERGITPTVIENAPTREDLGRVATWLGEGGIAPSIEAVLPLAEGAKAHAMLKRPILTRKIVLDHSGASA
jgi:NADPH2:quinone reductase